MQGVIAVLGIKDNAWRLRHLQLRGTNGETKK